MRIVAEVDEGIEIMRQLKKYEHINCQGAFGRLSFELDVAHMLYRDMNELVEELNEVDQLISVSTNDGMTVTFDYYITSDLLPEIRGAVNKAQLSKGVLLYWVFDDTIPDERFFHV